MASSFSGLGISATKLLTIIARILGVDFTLTEGGWRLVLDGSSDGNDVTCSLYPRQGQSQLGRVVPIASFYGAVQDSAGVSAALTAGVNATIALANVAGDLLAVKEVATGGGAADHFSVVRVSNSLVKAQAHDAAGALVAGNTSTVRVYTLGQL